MLKKKFFPSALFSLVIATAAHAFAFNWAPRGTTNTLYGGRLVSLERCADDNKGIFSTSKGCRKLAVSSTTCNVSVDIDQNGNYRRVQIELPALVQDKISHESIVTAKFKGPFYFSGEFEDYSGRLNLSNASAEVKVDTSSKKILALSVYADHRFTANGDRTYLQYTCGNLKRVR